MKRLLTVLSTCALAGLVGSTGTAGAHTPLDPEVQRLTEQIAVRSFPGSPCAGRVSMTVAAIVDGRENVNGMAWMDGSCRMQIAERVLARPTLYCEVWVHEYGHLAGHHHSAASGDLMFAFASGTWGPCQAVAPALPTCRESTALIRRMLPGRGVQCVESVNDRRVLLTRRRVPNAEAVLWEVFRPSLGAALELRRADER